MIWDFSGREEPGCMISYSKLVINRDLWKVASANCLCAVSQGSLCAAAPAQFTALETFCLCVSKLFTWFWEQWNICVPRRVRAERGKMMKGKKKGGFRERCTETSSLQGPSLPRVVPSCSAVTAGESLYTHTQVCSQMSVPFMPCKTQSSCISHRHRMYSVSLSIM